MNCDQAFDCLTDSHRRHSAELERHLAGCPRCQQMHDTLEPALDLFDGVVEEPDLSGLVRDSRPLVSTESRQLAEQTAARLATAGGVRRRHGNWIGFVRYAAVFVCGAVVVLVLGTAQQRFGGDPPSAPLKCEFWGESAETRRGLSAEAAIARCGECHHDQALAPQRPSPRGDGRGDKLRVLKFPEIGRLNTGGAELLARLQPLRAARPQRTVGDGGRQAVVPAPPSQPGLPLAGSAALIDAWGGQFHHVDAVAPATAIPLCQRSPAGRTGGSERDVSALRQWPGRVAAACDSLVAPQGRV